MRRKPACTDSGFPENTPAAAAAASATTAQPSATVSTPPAALAAAEEHLHPDRLLLRHLWCHLPGVLHRQQHAWHRVAV